MNEQQQPSKDKEIAKDPVPFPDEVIHLEETMQKQGRRMSSSMPCAAMDMVLSRM